MHVVSKKLGTVAVLLIAIMSAVTCHARQNKKAEADAGFYLSPHLSAGQTLSFITYRVISLYGTGIEDSVVTLPATGTYIFQSSPSSDIIRWKADVRMDGKRVLKNVEGEYRDHGTTTCYGGKCSLDTNASGPFYNPTFWGTPQGELKAGETWTVTLSQPWELGPPGTQTVTVISVDKVNGIVVLKREGDGVGPYEGTHETASVKKDSKIYKVATRFGRAHWSGQAVIQHGVIVSDELLCTTPVELSSPDFGTVEVQSRQYMSVLEHPGAIGA
ncbi:hypothetical protein [Acidipila rosea]|uniref:Uncharacterized protein n=1 Tax=Acidipila rosea TaxID=768535 RepID=A0A4R1L6F3_9BACT|nr:hypothetical protein [Acidipila rosea]TCK71859.1 hypothetical protein C7378_2480 [Acidipila rosea]